MLLGHCCGGDGALLERGGAAPGRGGDLHLVEVLKTGSFRNRDMVASPESADVALQHVAALHT